jgi:hypothetical protein
MRLRRPVQLFTMPHRPDWSPLLRALCSFRLRRSHLISRIDFGLPSALLVLPFELLQTIASLLPPLSRVAFGRTCYTCYVASRSELAHVAVFEDSRHDRTSKRLLSAHSASGKHSWNARKIRCFSLRVRFCLFLKIFI